MRDIFDDPLSVAAYDRLWRESLPGTSVAGDVAFYCAQARRARGPVLELGGGTGRVAFPLAAAGHAVTALDISSRMLRVARAKAALLRPSRRPRFVWGTMERFALGRRFRLILIPFRAFQHLLTPAAQRSCLACCRRHLARGGRLIVDLFDPRLDLLLPERPVAKRARLEFSDRAGRLTVLGRRVGNDAVRQVLTERWEFIQRDPRGARPRRVRRARVRIRLRWTYRWEMRHLLELSGFRPLACYGDFRGGPPRYGREQVWVAART